MFSMLLKRQIHIGVGVMKRTAAILLFVLSANISIAGPFGVEVTEFDLDRYGCSASYSRENYYDCEKFPAPEEDLFYSYEVKFVDGQGLCSIEVNGPSISGDNRYGTMTKAAVDQVFSRVSQVYSGPEPLKLDRALPDSIWQGDEYFMKALHKMPMERLYIYSGSVDQPSDGVVEYMVGALPDGLPDASRVYTIFTINNSSECSR